MSSAKRLMVLCLIGSFFAACVTAFDNFIAKQVIVAPLNHFIAVLVYLTLGSWVGVVTLFVTSNLFGKRLTSNFSRIRFHPLSKMRYAIIIGLASSIATLFSLWASQIVDPTFITIFSGITTFYIVIYDVMTKRVKLAGIFAPALFVIVGSVLASLNDAITWQATLLGLFIVIVCKSGVSAFIEILSQRGVEQRSMDTVNFTFWRFFFLAVGGTALSFTISLAMGEIEYYLSLLWQLLPIALPLLIMLMVIVTFANNLNTMAREHGQASQVSLLLELQLVFIFIITVVANSLIPGVFGALPTLPGIWALRLIGGGLIIFGVIQTGRIAGHKPISAEDDIPLAKELESIQ